METYNAYLIDKTITPSLFHISIIELIYLSAIVMILQHVVASPIAKKAAFSFIAQKNRKFTITLIMSVSMVLCMCPLMSLVATFLFKDIGYSVFHTWGNTFLWNLPMALFWQLLIAGPLVRLIIAKIFQKGDKSL